ncbi:MAG: methyltransferase domain-containing protein [Bacillota bacterium]|jgi:SAM-dependent methyltransferase
MSDEFLRPCLFCQSKNLTDVSEAGKGLRVRELGRKIDIKLTVCNDCGLLFQNPLVEKELLQRYLEKHYTGFKNIDLAVERPINQVTCSQRDFLLKHIHYKPEDPVRLLEIGCYEGDFLRLFADYRWELRGIEPSESGAAYAEKKYGLKIDRSLMEEVEFKPGEYDVIVLRHVLEHILDPGEQIARLYESISPNGYIYIVVPNAKTPWISITNGFFTLEHITHFTIATLGNLLRKAGFEVIAVDDQPNFVEIRMIGKKVAEKPVFRMSNDRDDILQAIHSYQTERQRLREEVHQRLVGLVAESGKTRVVIYGAGGHTEDLLELFDFSQFHVLGIADKNRSRQGESFYGYEIIPPEQILALAPDYVIISSYDFQEEIYNAISYLQDHGIKVVKLYDRVKAFYYY